MITMNPCFSLTGRRVLPAAVLFLLLPLAVVRGLAADAPANPDVLVFTNGDQLTGKLVNSAGGKVIFHSDMAGDVTVDWAKVKEIRTAQKFAVILNGVKPSRKNPEAVPQGAVTIADQTVQVHPDTGAAPAPIPVKNINFLIDDPTFQSKIKTEPGFFHAWHGSATGGATIVEATQTSYSFNGAITLARVIPDVTWLEPKNRTTTDFSASYGKITDPGYVQPASRWSSAHPGNVRPRNYGEVVDLSLRF